VNPGFWSCDTVGINQPPIIPVQDSVNVIASFLQYQVLETSPHLGATNQAVLEERQTTNPLLPAENLEPKGVSVSSSKNPHNLTSCTINSFTVRDVLKPDCPINCVKLLIVLIFLTFYLGTKYK
jgi:hypothetical protein